ncbi:helix-turn-helix transcriptional regulator [Paenibacillus roseipurpureus]|uniref:AraC family transcriptional regulator n=1 Tax=Paenibacillus roseopurpureus TaxID=2918901 RepID=A0AA96RLB5_9BACL|nr:AraC family transcriptional regulator [Paenibacillus sp. MBLB1832]WNR42982.1 AraC family transcriptional regulator [Paenibacillus sp. MBLB1832]
MIKTTLSFQIGQVPHSLIFPEFIGWSEVTEPSYTWDGQNRPDNRFLFQYTITGVGKLHKDGILHSLPQGHAFLIQLNGDYRYYFDPAASEHWEFLWLQVSGSLADYCWQEWTRSGSPVMQLPDGSWPIRLLKEMYARAREKGYPNKYELTRDTYRWCTSLFEYLERGTRSKVWEDAIERAKELMNSQFRDRLALEDLAEAAGLSKTYFCKVFLEATGISPMTYLLRKRLEEAVKLLKHSSLSVKDIAITTGFDNSGYFGKVFHKQMGLAPAEFRRRSVNSVSTEYSDRIYLI